MASECTDRKFSEKKDKGLDVTTDKNIAIVLSECNESKNSNLASKILSLNASVLSAQIGGAYNKKSKGPITYAGFKTLQECVSANKKVEDDPLGYCLMKREMKSAKLDIELEGIPTESTDPLTEKKKGLSEIISGRLKSKLTPSIKVGTKFRIGSLESFDGRYATFFFLEGDMINGRGWGVTKASIPENIKTAKDMPYVITSNEFHPNSVYRGIFDHPSLEHLVPLGLARMGEVDVNDEAQLLKFQRQFRVGNMFDTFHNNADDTWRVMVEIDEPFRDMTLPPFVSPAVWKENDNEPDEAMSHWHVNHLAGLDVRPAYGNKAIKKAECFGSLMKCQPQLRVASTKIMLPCEFNKLVYRMKMAKAYMAVLTSPTISDTQVQNVFGCKKKDEQGNCLSAKAKYGLEGDPISGEGTRMNLVTCTKRDEKGNCIKTNSKKPI